MKNRTVVVTALDIKRGARYSTTKSAFARALRRATGYKFRVDANYDEVFLDSRDFSPVWRAIPSQKLSNFISSYYRNWKVKPATFHLRFKLFLPKYIP